MPPEMLLACYVATGMGWQLGLPWGCRWVNYHPDPHRRCLLYVEWVKGSMTPWTSPHGHGQPHKRTRAGQYSMDIAAFAHSGRIGLKAAAPR